MLHELASVMSAGQFWLTFLGVSVVPYAMYIVAYVFEGRRPGFGPNDVPIWRDQSRAFMPGDFGLALLVTVCLQYRSDVTAGWADSPWFGAASLVAASAICLVARRKLYTPADYTKRAWNSPSKQYHDWVMFFGFAAAAVYVCLPVLVLTNWPTNVLVMLVGLFGLAVWVLGNVWDFTHDETPNARQHPSLYHPIWRR